MRSGAGERADDAVEQRVLIGRGKLRGLACACVVVHPDLLLRAQQGGSQLAGPTTGVRASVGVHRLAATKKAAGTKVHGGLIDLVAGIGFELAAFGSEGTACAYHVPTSY
jgi:hypothetical protein